MVVEGSDRPSLRIYPIKLGHPRIYIKLPLTSWAKIPPKRQNILVGWMSHSFGGSAGAYHLECKLPLSLAGALTNSYKMFMYPTWRNNRSLGNNASSNIGGKTAPRTLNHWQLCAYIPFFIWFLRPGFLSAFCGWECWEDFVGGERNQSAQNEHILMFGFHQIPDCVRQTSVDAGLLNMFIWNGLNEFMVESFYFRISTSQPQPSLLDAAKLAAASAGCMSYYQPCESRKLSSPATFHRFCLET